MLFEIEDQIFVMPLYIKEDNSATNGEGEASKPPGVPRSMVKRYHTCLGSMESQFNSD